ncbi:MAG: hypothetical protein AMJ79_15780 [Phycisphaerae bacterium SM23_30]|nr:MAG: hypothetical protein AMJ79_15780 [Phycisphaerae bacterium SM23_30]
MALPEFRNKSIRIRSIRDIVERFHVNSEGYIREYRIFLVLTVIAAVVDAASRGSPSNPANLDCLRPHIRAYRQ